MLTDIFFLVLGLVLILAGANILTDGASAIAKRLGVSDLVIGLTVVAFGTSAPELVISIVSAIEDKAELAVGNVVGSNIFNILAIIGITAAIRPIHIRKSVMENEIPMVVLSSLVLLVLGNSNWLNGGGQNSISRVDAILLIVFGLLFLRYTLASARHSLDPASDPTAEQAASKSDDIKTVRAILYIIGGLAGLIWGGDKFVDGASGIAKSFGVSDAVIGLTIVAVGTSLPELATSIVASIKGKPGLAVGNVIGSNIFNVVFVLGIAGLFSPLNFGEIGNVDLLTLTGASLLFLLFGRIIKTREITRAEGIILAACYITYMVYLVATV